MKWSSWVVLLGCTALLLQNITFIVCTGSAGCSVGMRTEASTCDALLMLLVCTAVSAPHDPDAGS